MGGICIMQPYLTEESSITHEIAVLHPKTQGPSVLNGLRGGLPITLIQNDGSDVPQSRVQSRYVLSHLGVTKEYKLFGPYICTLTELILFTQGKLSYDLECTETEEPLLSIFRFLDENNRPARGGIYLLRDVLKGLCAIYDQDLLHGALNTDNIVICLEDRRLRAKLTGVKDPETESADNDALAGIISSCFEGVTEAGTPYYPAEVLELCQCVLRETSIRGLSNEWDWLINLTEQKFHTDPTQLRKYPMFWFGEMAMIFMVQYRILIRQCRRFRHIRVVRNFLAAVNKINTRGWFSSLPRSVKEGIHRSSRSDETHFLLRHIRNIYIHPDSKSEDFKKTVGSTPEKVFEYFMNKFPDMILETHAVLQYHFAAVQNATGFGYSFEKYLIV